MYVYIQENEKLVAGGSLMTMGKKQPKNCRLKQPTKTGGVSEMTHQQILKGIIWVILGAPLLGAWIWRTARPYLVWRDIRNGSVKPEASVLWFFIPQIAIFLILPVVAFTVWPVGPWGTGILIAMFVSGCLTVYFGSKIWTEIKRKK